MCRPGLLVFNASACPAKQADLVRYAPNALTRTWPGVQSAMREQATLLPCRRPELRLSAGPTGSRQTSWLTTGGDLGRTPPHQPVNLHGQNLRDGHSITKPGETFAMTCLVLSCRLQLHWQDKLRCTCLPLACNKDPAKSAFSNGRLFRTVPAKVLLTTVTSLLRAGLCTCIHKGSALSRHPPWKRFELPIPAKPTTGPSSLRRLS